MLCQTLTQTLAVRPTRGFEMSRYKEAPRGGYNYVDRASSLLMIDSYSDKRGTCGVYKTSGVRHGATHFVGARIARPGLAW